MYNNPAIFVDSDGQWAHIAVGAFIGGGTKIVSILLVEGVDGLKSGRNWAKIGTASLAGAAVAANPTILAASVIGGSNDIVGQGIDFVFDTYEGKETKPVNFKSMFVSSALGAAGALGGKFLDDAFIGSYKNALDGRIRDAIYSQHSLGYLAGKVDMRAYSFSVPAGLFAANFYVDLLSKLGSISFSEPQVPKIGDVVEIGNLGTQKVNGKVQSVQLDTIEVVGKKQN